jgi:hypothetical protein
MRDASRSKLVDGRYLFDLVGGSHEWGRPPGQRVDKRRHECACATGFTGEETRLKAAAANIGHPTFGYKPGT